MSKVATYLRGHLAGEVDFRTDLRAARARDAGILAIVPEMVVSPRNTSDIRKTARFSWQLSERGHALPLVAPGVQVDAQAPVVDVGHPRGRPGTARRPPKIGRAHV